MDTFKDKQEIYMEATSDLEFKFEKLEGYLKNW